MPIELTLLGASTLLLFAHVMIQGQTVTRERGLDWNAGARDGQPPQLGPLAGRAARALGNFQETYPAFIALALGLAVTGQTGGLGEAGAILWFAARIAYIPLYLMGVKYIRSLAWTLSMLGLLLMLIRFF
ncbi:putative MAPEG superfamily protein [Sphingomonas insulae]|uniref:MAPEG family protein n=1 Tax=Sphingomonas insulae TaxID=424800 RepID=A0ABP3T6R5_9SPHN|nr:MAPEG family protein [Sphingomonas insulae]NIJ29978.1 putative MAPEG superfamily protein [Sphingomonas insulae]